VRSAPETSSGQRNKMRPQVPGPARYRAPAGVRNGGARMRPTSSRIVSLSPNHSPAAPVSSAAPQLLVYVASPLSTYQTKRYDLMLAYARRHFLDADLLPARGLYRDTAHWRQSWPRQLHRITTLVFFAATDGSIGRGVVTEIEDARRHGVPVHFL